MSYIRDLQYLESANSIIDSFLNSTKKYPNRNALWVDKKYYTYKKLLSSAEYVASFISDSSAERVLIFSRRTISAYRSIIATMIVGRTYVPLNPKMPASRNAMMMRLADTELLIADYSVSKELEDIIRSYNGTHLKILFLT